MVILPSVPVAEIISANENIAPLMHIFAGFLIAAFFRAARIRTSAVFLIVLAFALQKELYDALYGHGNETMDKHLSDILVTLSGAVLGIPFTKHILKLGKSSESTNRNGSEETNETMPTGESAKVYFVSDHLAQERAKKILSILNREDKNSPGAGKKPLKRAA